MTELAKTLCEVGSANVSDALRTLGRHFQAMDGGMRPLDPSMKCAGPAFTVRCYPGATFAIEKALEEAKLGDVLVVDGGGVPDVILMGGLMSLRAKTRGIAGAVLDAAVRDVSDVIAIPFPMFSRYICPRAGTFAEIGERNTIICCGRIPVRPGDWIVADSSGIAVIPSEMLEATHAKALEIHHREQKIQSGLLAGKTLSQAAADA
jgi:3-hexulose-6-phosphate synthase / 6-phospho-3-hexuloisomerase